MLGKSRLGQVKLVERPECVKRVDRLELVESVECVTVRLELL